MCIAIFSTMHSDYPFILLSNRDEFVRRPTAAAAFWAPPHGHILSGRDLQSPVRGTWLGLTRQGRLAVLTNFREPEADLKPNARSRGEISKAWLTGDEGEEEFVQHLLAEDRGLSGVDGFSLLFGLLRKPKGKQGARRALGVISNRTPDAQGIIWVGGEASKENWNGGGTVRQTCALSNSYYGDREWPKVVMGEELLGETIRESETQKESLDALMARCFRVLSTDTLPKREKGQTWDAVTSQLRKSIFVPHVVGEAVREEQKSVENMAAVRGHERLRVSMGVYGTQKQTVIIVDWEGRVTFVERTLNDEEAMPIRKEEQDRRFEFQIQGWDS